MRTAPFRLLTIVAVASMSAACGDDAATPGADADATTPPDGTTGETTNTPDGTTPSEVTETTTPDVTETVGPTCGVRECGTFGTLDCGTCDHKPGTECNDNGRCIVPGKPLGAFCGITSTCTVDSDQYPGCLDEQCETNLCMSNTSGGAIVFALYRDWGAVVSPNSFCTASCQMYKDSNNDGVNDADAQDDCNPPDIVDGPVGNGMRCVNFAGIGENPVGLCIPGSTFAKCDEPSDCPSGESCELTSVVGLLEGRCVGNYKAGAWGDVAGLGEACNDDPEAGKVALCEAGFCGFAGCSTSCGDDGDCLTVAPGVCSAGKCAGKPGKTCAADADCSSFTCRKIYSDIEFTSCFPKPCGDEDDCGGGYSCSWGWNGSVRNPEQDNQCVPYLENGKDLGEGCDPDPTDNQVINGGAVCKTDLCIGQKCSLVCTNDDMCGEGVCAFYELTGANIACDVDADCGAGNACTGTDGACYDPVALTYLQGENDSFSLGLQFCTSLEGSTGSCQSNADCAASETCELYAKQNYDGDTIDPDAPVTIEGSCMASVGAGDLGDECTGFADCKSGFCLPITDTFSMCSQTCTASSECGSFNIGEDAVNGYCDSYLYGYAGDLDNFYNFTYVGLCVFDFGSTADCSDDFSCDAATEACFPNALAGADPTKQGAVESLCFQVWETEAERGTKALGAACDPAAEVIECASGLCTTEVGDDTKGYCSALCTQGGDECGTGALACTELVRNPRAGAYAVNTSHFSLCLKDQDCAECGSQLDCPGSLVCANLGTAASAAYRCVEGCTEVADCADAAVTTACNDTTDSLGVAAKGCFAKSAGGVPVNYCGN